MNDSALRALVEARNVLADCVKRADTPDGIHPFLFDTMSLVEAKSILVAIEAALAATSAATPGWRDIETARRTELSSSAH